MSKLIDLTNQTFGKLTVISRAENIKTPNGRTHVAWKCRCECGKEIIVRSDNLRMGYTKSCGCNSKGHRVIDEVGNKYGKLTVVSRAESDNDHKALWLCKCDCGGMVVTSGKRLRNGMTKSCGCIHSSKELEINLFLQNNNINFKREVGFEDLLSEKQAKLRYDFAIYNGDNSLIGLLEYMGEQHYINYNRGYYTVERLQVIKEHDKLKEEYAKKHNYSLLILNKNNYSEELILKWLGDIGGIKSSSKDDS